MMLDLGLWANSALTPQFPDQRWHDLEQVADDAVVSHAENRRFPILVDGDDGG
jgi:hypothetical protein